MDAYDLGIKQRPCPAAAVNTTDLFFSVAYQRDNPASGSTAVRCGEYFNTNYDSAAYPFSITRQITYPTIFGEYGYYIQNCRFPASALRTDLPSMVSGKIQISSWMLAAHNTVFGFIYSASETIALVLVKQSANTYKFQFRGTAPYAFSSFSGNVSLSDSTWVYVTAIIDSATYNITATIYVNSNFIATLNAGYYSSFYFIQGLQLSNSYHRDFIMRKWTTGDTVFTPTRLLTLS